MKRIISKSSLFIKLALLVLLFFTISTANDVRAQVSVDKIIFRFEYGKSPVQNVLVKNNGTEAVHITALSEIVERAGFPDEHRVEAKNLILSPKRFSIQPNGERVVRLLIKDPKASKDREQVYRVRFLPQAQGFDEELAVERSGRKAMVKVLFSVGILVFDEPAEIKPVVNWTREGSKIIFTNTGNANMYLNSGKACLDKDEDKCIELPSKRLYPDNTFEVIAPSPAHFVNYQQTVGIEHTVVSIPPE